MVRMLFSLTCLLAAVSGALGTRTRVVPAVNPFVRASPRPLTTLGHAAAPVTGAHVGHLGVGTRNSVAFQPLQTRGQGAVAYVRSGLVSRLSEPTDKISSSPAEAFDLGAYLESQAQKVETALDESLTPTSPFNVKITDAMRYSLMAGGKRIRPILCLAAYEMIARGDNAAPAEQVAMPTGVAIEMIHTMSLIHDDLPAMDNDDLRRGKPTSHVKYGEDIAILAGDALLSEAFVHIARATPKSVPAERVLDVIKRLGDSMGASGLVGGQAMDLECEAKQSATLEELQWIHEHKTAALLEIAVVGGALLAGATEKEILACETFARKIGLAFQVADDILDVTATSEQLGKTAGKDEVAEKTTYVKLLGLDGAKAQAEKLREEAVSALDSFGSRGSALRAIAEYIVKRQN